MRQFVAVIICLLQCLQFRSSAKNNHSERTEYSKTQVYILYSLLLKRGIKITEEKDSMITDRSLRACSLFGGISAKRAAWKNGPGEK